MTYTFGATKARLPAHVLVEIRQGDRAAEIRGQAAHILGLAAESRNLREARRELAVAKAAAARTEYERLTFEQRMARAEVVRAAAFVLHGYDPAECAERLEKATAERTKNCWGQQKRREGRGW